MARLAVIFVVALSACQSAAETDAARLANDQSAAAEINRINALLASSQPVTRIDIDSLNAIRTRYPNSTVVRQILQGALIKRQDWAAAEALISETPRNELTDADKLNLAKIYLKQGKFTDAARLLGFLPPTTEVTALFGQTRFYLGDVNGAATTFESVLPGLANEKRVDDMAILGTIYLRRGEHAKAIDVLQKAVEIGPDNVSASNALSRAYAAAGDAEKSETYRARVEELNDKIAAAEKKKSRLVPLFYQLEDAYAAKDFDKVISLVQEIQPDADDATRAALYKYLAAAYQAQGKVAEANNALAEAAKLK